MIRQISVLALSLLLFPAVVAGARPPVPQVELVASSPAEVQVRVPFEAPTRVETQVGNLHYTYFDWDQAPPDGEPGSPAMPTHRIRVAVPPRGELSLSVETETRGSSGGIRFPPVPSLVEEIEIPRSRRERRPHEALSEGGRYLVPESTPHAEIVSVGIERGVRVATVAVRPVSWNPGTGTASWASSVTIRIRNTGASSVPAKPARRDRAGEHTWQRTLVNPRDAAAYRTSASDSLTAGIPDSWFDDGGGWLKVRIPSNGIYVLNHQTLAGAGVPVATLDPRTLRLHAGPLVPEVGWAATGWDTLPCSPAKVITRKEHVYDRPEFSQGFGGIASTGNEVFGQVAIWVRGEEDGVFNNSDQVVFYGLGPDNFRDRFGLPLETGEDYLVNPYTDHTVYWLTWGGNPSGNALRMEEIDATPTGGTPVTQSMARVHAEENTVPDRSLYQGGLRWEGWFWDFMFSDEGVKFFSVDLPYLVSGTPMSTVIRLWGAKIPTRTDSGEPTRHHVRATVNGESVGLHSWGGSQPAVSLTAYDVVVDEVRSDNPSDFRFQVLDMQSVDPSRLDQVHLTWIDVAYQRHLELGGQAGELEVDAGPAGRPVRIGSPPGGTPLVFEVSDYRNPRRLTGAAVGGGGVTVSLDRPLAAVVAVTSETALLAPRSVELDDPPRTSPGSGVVSWLRDDTEPLDYVIIAHDDLADAGEILADWRRDHLYPFTPDRPGRVRVVRVSDVMDEFAWGMWDPAAVRHFLEYAYCFYGGAGDDPLSYAVFLGDATNDPRDYGRSGVPDFVPSWEDTRDDIVRISWGSVQFVSDDPLARFDDPNESGCPDAITDLYIGRISPRTPALAEEIIRNKVIRAEESPDLGPWRTKAVLVADDLCQGTRRDPLGSVHMTQMEQVAAIIPKLFSLEKIYLYEFGNECIYSSKPDAKQALLSAWSEGAWMVNYIGHGADVVWADEHVLDLSDTPLLANDGRYPVVGSFSCSVGKFSNPVRDGLGEAHFLAPRGGSLVSAAASHLTSSFSNVLFNLEFVRQMFSGGSNGPIPIGVALMNAKRIRSDGESHKYVCLGDPASFLSIPQDSLTLDGPPSLDRGALIELGAEVAGPGDRSGVMNVVVRDAEIIRDTDENGDPISFSYRLPGALLFRGETVVEADTAGLSFTVPVSLRGGDSGSIRAYAWGNSLDAAGALVPLEVGGLAVANDDTIGPTVVFSVMSGSVATGEKVTITLEDPSGINLTQLFEFRSILLKVLDRNGLEQFRQDLTPLFAYESGSHTRGALDLVIPDFEPAPYTFTLSATDNYNNRSVESVQLEVGDLSGAVEFEDVVGAYPNPFSPEVGPTRLMFSLSRRAEVQARVYSVSGRLVREETIPGIPGQNVYIWDGQDSAMDAVANGVYLVQLTIRGEDDGDTRRHLERVVVLR